MPNPDGAVRIGFMMDQVAGHITNYRNLRRITESDTEIDAVWHEVSSYRPEGRLERARERWLRFVPGYVTGNVRAAVELRAGLREGPYDAVYSNVRTGVFYARRFARTPTLIDFDVTPIQLDAMEAYGRSHDPKPVAALKWKLAKRMFHSARVLQAWSNWAKQSVVDDYDVPPERVIVNPPGVDLSFWRPEHEHDSGDSRDLKRVLFVGGDFRRKGGEILLDWHRRHGGGVELHVVTREDVAGAPDLYVYRNMQPNTGELLNLYRQADLFVLPSLGECFGIATVEAMAAGLPVIATDVGGTADIIEDGGNGFITPAGDERALEAQIATILDDDSLREAMGNRSRELAVARFDVDRNARRTLSELKSMARLE
jgi:glycosyltransferase involved in cell wall biosynthesis